MLEEPQHGVNRYAATQLAGHVLRQLKVDSEGLAFGCAQAGKTLAGVDSFVGIYEPRLTGCRRPCLVACAEGVGPKLGLALKCNKYSGIGVDLVAKVVNDLYSVGAKPLFFMDYVAASHLDEEVFAVVMRSMREALKICGTALLGGETHEIAGMFSPGHFDLAGFGVGLVDGERVLAAERVGVGAKLVAWPASGFHAQGYALIRKWLRKLSAKRQAHYEEFLLRPTRLYPQFLQLLDRVPPGTVQAAAHVAGGGVIAHLAQLMPPGLSATLDLSQLRPQEMMVSFAREVEVNLFDHLGVFNLGTGWVTVVAPEFESTWIALSRECGLDAWTLGEVVSLGGEDGPKVAIS